MNVVAINGSPRKEGNTYQALKLVLNELEKEGIKTEIIHVGNKKLNGCISCYGCVKNQNEKCVFDDYINEIIPKLKEADGILLGSPVHFADMGGAMKSFLDRTFFVSSVNGNLFRHKVGASIVAVRRSGGLSTFNQLNNYLTFSEMIIPASNYWNIIHGKDIGELMKDEEGLQIMRVLGKNMAWTLKILENGKDKISAPQKETKTYMNFIR